MRRIALVIILSALSAGAQERADNLLAGFIRANDRAGMRMLKEAYALTPGTNTAVSPLPVNMVLVTMEHNESARGSYMEYFGSFDDFSDATHLLLGRFPRPVKKAAVANGAAKNSSKPQSVFPKSSLDEELWMTNKFSAERQHPATFLSKEFIPSAEYASGMRFEAGGSCQNNPQAHTPLGFCIQSNLHLKSNWSGELFGFPQKKDFRLATGTTISVDTLPTSESRFRHVKTSSFEAIELHARESNMIVILPDESQTAEGVIHMLESDPSSIEDSMTYERGDLRMPSFHIVKDVELKPVLEKMGLKSSFQRLTFVTAIEGGWLTTVASKVDVQVDKEGMRADARIMMGGVIGGICSNCPPPPTPFHMVVNRPFLFLIRDRVTNVLMFVGVVMDPTQQ